MITRYGKISICTLLVCGLYMPAYAQFDRSTRQRRRHLATALHLFERKEEKKRPRLINRLVEQEETQTGAHVQRLLGEIMAAWPVEEHSPMIDRIVERERAYADAYYIFYHAHKSQLRLLHDVIKELYRFFFAPASLKHFTFLRFWQEYSSFAKPHEFLCAQGHISHWIDHHPNIRKQIISVNLSLFGNVTKRGWGECTFQFYLANHNIDPPNLWHAFTSIFASLGLNTKWIEQLIALMPDLQSEGCAGQLLQICIPKEKIDCYGYLSKPGGVPCGSLSDELHAAYDVAVGRYKSMVPILEAYTKKPKVLATNAYDGLQARLLLTKDFFDPNSGVIIHRYCQLPKEQIKQYKAKLHAILREALSEWCEAYAQKEELPKSLQDSAIMRLFNQENSSIFPLFT